MIIYIVSQYKELQAAFTSHEKAAAFVSQMVRPDEYTITTLLLDEIQ